MAETKHHPRRLAPYPPTRATAHVLGLKGRQQDDFVIAGEPASSLPVQFVHQVDDPLPQSGLRPPHPTAFLVVGFGIGAADQVVQPVAEPLDAAKGVVANLAAVGFGKAREKGANARVERHYAITAWGLDVALRRVRNDQPIQAALLHQSAFFVLPPGWFRPSAAVREWCDRRRAP